MKPKILLSIASGIIILHSAGHLFGMASRTNAETEEQKMVVRAMKDHSAALLAGISFFLTKKL